MRKCDRWSTVPRYPLPSWFSVSLNLNATNQFTMKGTFYFPRSDCKHMIGSWKKKGKMSWRISVPRTISCTSIRRLAVLRSVLYKPLQLWSEWLETMSWRWRLDLPYVVLWVLRIPYSIHGTWSQTPAPVIYDVYNAEYRVSCKLYSVLRTAYVNTYKP